VEEELARAIAARAMTFVPSETRGEGRHRGVREHGAVLASHGLARGPSEVPYEYLARVLQLLNVRGSAVRSLTELFEYAKFSKHEIDHAMKSAAIESLVAVREDLQVTRSAQHELDRRPRPQGRPRAQRRRPGSRLRGLGSPIDPPRRLFPLGMGGVLLLALVRTDSAKV